MGAIPVPRTPIKRRIGEGGREGSEQWMGGVEEKKLRA